MNNTHKIAAAIVVAVVVIGGIYLYKQKASAPSADNGATVQQTASAPHSLRDLMALGTSQKCTFSNTTANGSSDGVIYIADGHMRGDFSTKASSGQVMMSHMISDGTQMRMWQDGQTTGFLMQVQAQANATATTPSQPQTQPPVGYDDPNVKYECNPWVADDSLFTPPATITFKTMAEMMQGAMTAHPGAMTGGSDEGMGPGMEAGGSVDMKTMQCNACNGAPTEAAKAQCRAALQCS